MKDQQGNDASLADYRGRVLLVVEHRHGVRFHRLHVRPARGAVHHPCTSVVWTSLDFPCDPIRPIRLPVMNEEIAPSARPVSGVTFPQFAKIEVNGEGADPLFAYLQQQKGLRGASTRATS